MNHKKDILQISFIEIVYTVMSFVFWIYMCFRIYKPKVYEPTKTFDTLIFSMFVIIAILRHFIKSKVIFSLKVIRISSQTIFWIVSILKLLKF